MSKNNPQKIFFLILFSLLFLVVLRIFSPYVSALLWAGMFYLMISPIYNKIINKPFNFKHPFFKLNFWQKIKLKQRFFALLFTFASLFIVFIPLAVLVVEFSRQMIEQINNLIYFIEGDPRFASFDELELWLASFNLPFDISRLDIRGFILSFLNNIPSHISNSVLAVGSGLGGFLLGFLFMMVSLYFYLSEGPNLLNLLIRAIPIERSYSQIFINRFAEAGKAILLGFFITALGQAIVAYIIFSVAGIRATLVLSALVFVISFIPMLGATAVWVPLAILQLIQTGNILGFLIFSGSCALFISSIDMFYKPWVLGNRVNIHPLLILFSLLGGIQLFGLNGIVLGPMLLTLFFASLEIFLKENPYNEDNNLLPGPSINPDKEQL
ncbi:MAG: AI-2E family transporter [Spirochaetaceae bacterium]|nr:AI-2E family transporter [Spirochaetaceae bacterium]